MNQISTESIKRVNRSNSFCRLLARNRVVYPNPWILETFQKDQNKPGLEKVKCWVKYRRYRKKQLRKNQQIEKKLRRYVLRICSWWKAIPGWVPGFSRLYAE